MENTRVLLLGATGKTGRHIRQILADDPQVNLTSVVRHPVNPYPDERVEIGDVTNLQFMKTVMTGQDMVIAALSGDLLAEAQVLHQAALDTQMTRLVWLTGIGIHREARGQLGAMLNKLADYSPEFVQAAEVIADPQLAYTLVRLPQLLDQEASHGYQLTRQNEAPKMTPISRVNVAQFLLALVKDPTKYVRESISINNQD